MRRRGRAVVCTMFVAATIASISCSDYGAAITPSDDAGADAGVTEGGATDANGASDAPGSSDADASECAADSCEARTECTLNDFAASCDPFTFSGNLANTTHECTGGKLRIAASGTEDLTAMAAFPAPTGVKTRTRFAARINIAKWDGKRLLRLSSGANELVDIRVDDLLTGMVVMKVCVPSGGCAQPTRNVAANVEHLVVVDITASGAALSVDCAPVASIATASVGSALSVELGTQDASPIDATIDDVVVWFEL